MEGIFTIIDGDLVFLTVEGKFSFRYSVAHPTDGRAKIGFGTLSITFNAAHAYDHIAPVTLFIANPKANNAGPIIGELSQYAIVTVPVQAACLAVRQRIERYE